MIGKIINNNCIEYFKELQDNSVDLIFTDPPYALGSEVIIRQDGKPDYKKAVDFMDKWEQPDGKFWEQWFKEAYRVLKYGCRVVMFGMDRQIMLNKYYACLSGFEEQQSLYWYFISNFPKSLDLSKIIDKNACAEREVVGISESTRINKPNSDVYDAGIRGKVAYITTPTTELAKKYDGYKYSVAPLKQTNETIMVFQKPYKTGSCLHDTLAYENGDAECCCGAIDVDKNRVPFESEADKKESTDKNQHEDFGTNPMTDNIIYGDFSMVQPKNYMPEGRYPAQTYIDNEAAKVLDEQSGIQKGEIGRKNRNELGTKSKYWGTTALNIDGVDDIGGCSRILHKCDYDEKDFDLYIYCPKVGNEERNAGCESLPEKIISGEDTGFGKMGINSPKYRECRGVTSELPKVFNGHPTVKPINLLIKVLSLFKTPNPQIVLDTFAGSGSTGIACEKLGIEYILVDDKKEYCDIAELRTKYWSEYFKNEIHINNVAKSNEPIIENQLELF
jgi:site-specific DNA-methyltransferase (adenine-specific)